MASLIGLWAISVYVWCIRADGHSATYSRSEGAVGNKPNWMSGLSGTLPITEVSIPGTHDTMADDNGDIPDCQTMHLRPQLDSGIRYLDIRLKVIEGGELWTYHGVIKLSENFETVLDEVIDFLNDNPSEFVIMKVMAEGTPNYDQSEFEDAILKRYADHEYSGHLYIDDMGCSENANQVCNDIPTVEEVRGKIVIIRDHYGDAATTGPYSDHCIKEQNDYTMNTNWDLYDKWTKIKNFAIETNNLWGSHITAFRLNYLSASGGSFPYFVASGHSSPQEGAPRLYTGHLSSNTASDRLWPDFPRRGCTWWFWDGELCSVDFEGTNRLFYDHILGSSSFKFTGIVVMDFPGEGLITRIILKNNLNQVSWSGWSPGSGLQECEGDCDSHNDCSGNLQCLFNGIPLGCYGAAYDPTADYCYDPSSSAKRVIARPHDLDEDYDVVDFLGGDSDQKPRNVVLTGQDLLMLILAIISVLNVIAVCCVCAQSKGWGAPKYSMVPNQGNFE